MGGFPTIACNGNPFWGMRGSSVQAHRVTLFLRARSGPTLRLLAQLGVEALLQSLQNSSALAPHFAIGQGLVGRLEAEMVG